MTSDSLPGEIFLGRYHLREEVGRGAHGIVYLAEDLGRGRMPVALKQIEGLVGAEPSTPAADLLRWIRHPNWAAIEDGGPTAHGGQFLVTRFIEGKSLDHVEGPQPIEQVWQLLEEGARVLRCLHGHGLIHYDVTPGNVMRESRGDGFRFVLTDGGLAHVGPVKDVARGTPAYMAPELTKVGAHDHRVDLYSLGLVAYRYLTGHDAFEGRSADLLKQRREHDAPLAGKLREDTPKELEQLLKSLLSRNPNERPHDALTLLERIAEARGTEHTPFTEDEILESTSGGPVFGREREIQRFEQTLDALAARLETDSQDHRRTPPKIPDPVLILTGEPGCGATSLARAYAHRARQRQIPVLLLAGRDRMTEQGSALASLISGLYSTSGASSAPSPRSEQGDLRYASQRSVEALLRASTQAAAQTPLVIVVEDSSDLEPSARQAITALARHLSSQMENDQGRPAPGIVVVVDTGDLCPDEFILNEAQDPEAAVMLLGPLAEGEISRLAEWRLPGAVLAPDQVSQLAVATAGNPGQVAAAIGEAVNRGLLSSEAGQWHWRVDDWDSLTSVGAADPRLTRSLERLTKSDRTALEVLALVGVPLPDQTLLELGLDPAWLGAAEGLLRRTAKSVGAKSRLVELSNSTAKEHLLRGLEAGALSECYQLAIDILSGCQAPRLVLRRAELILEHVGPRDSLHALGLSPCLPDDRHSQWRGTRLFSSILAAAPELVAEPAAQKILRDTRVDLGAISAVALEHVADSLIIKDVGDTLTLLRIAEGLEQHQHYDHAVRLLDRARHELGPLGVSLRTVRLRLLLNAGQTDVALEDGELTTASSIPDEAQFARAKDRVAYALVAAQLAHHSADTHRALHLLAQASKDARELRDLALRAQVYNNLGILHAISKQVKPAFHYLSRSARIKVLLGDVAGSARTRFNVGVLLHRSGQTAESVRQLRAAVALSVRHGLNINLVKILRELSALYDSQRNPQLALNTLERALRVADRLGLATQSTMLRADAAPLAAATGQPVHATTLLSEARASPAADGAHIEAQIILAELQAALHGGSFTSFDCTMKAFIQRRAALSGTFGEERATAAAACHQIWESRVSRDATRTQFPGKPTQGKLSVLREAAHLDTGLHRRLRAEQLLEVSRVVPSVMDSAAWQRCLAALEESGERTLLARLLARPALELADSDPRAAAQRLGISLKRLAYSNAMTAPDELRECAVRLSQETTRSTDSYDSVGNVRANLHALLVDSGLDDGGADTRRTVALRTILEATARMDAGGSLEDLLGDMTTSVIAITSAERSCVVLVENVVEMEVRVATSASGGARSVEIEDLSHTVIRRVIDSHSPLLLHDVYEDAELVERPSIASFELRSILCVPILRQGTLYGVLYADNASAAGSFDSVDLEVLTLFAKQAAAALQTNQLIADVQTSLRHLKETQAQLVRGERLRALGELSSGVAHEFNNLLTSILARVQLISLGALSPSLRGDLTIIERACLDAASVVRRLQTFSRSERQGHFQIVDVKEVCQDAMDFLNPLWSNRSRRGKPPIDVALDCAASYPVRGDATELREVLTNLIKNALEVLDGGGSIQVDVWSVDGMVKVAVADDGPGISADTLPRIFEPFFTTKGQRGTGLGLCLSQQIAERHRGSLTADSRPGTGTTFTLALPLLSESGTAPQHEDHLGVEQAGARGLVVVVDDEATVRDPLCGFLEKSGFTVQSASCAAEALTLCESSNPDLVVSDVSMPGMSGLELCRTLTGQGARARVILMSGKTDTNDATAATLAGAAAFIPKPFTLSQLADVVERVLGIQQEPFARTREELQDN